jgi:ribosomal protein S5
VLLKLQKVELSFSAIVVGDENECWTWIRESKDVSEAIAKAVEDAKKI